MDKLQRSLLAAGVTALCTVATLLPATAAMLSESPVVLDLAEPMKLEIAAGGMVFTPNGRELILMAADGGTISVFDMTTLSVKKTIAVPHDISDVAIDSNGSHVYLVGARIEPEGASMVSQLALADGSVRSVEFDRRLKSPSIALGEEGEVYGSASEAESLWSIPTSVFENATELSPLRFDLLAAKELYLKSGPAASITADPGERYLMFSHARERAVTAMDLRSGGIVDTLWLETRTGGKVEASFPLQLVVTTRAPNRRDGAVPSIVVGDYSGERFVVLDLDTKYLSFAIVQTVDLGLFLTIPDAKEESSISPLLLAADREQDTILAGSRLGERVALFRRDARTLEMQGIAELPFRPIDLDISPAGDVAAFLGEGGALLLLDDPGARRSVSTEDTTRDRVRIVQRALSMLGYPVGIVDGMEGAQTRAALGLWQERQGLKPTGAIDDDVVDLLEKALSETKL